MANNEKKAAAAPSVEQMQQELAHVRYKKQYAVTLLSTINIIAAMILVVVAAVLFLPVLRLQSDSMAPTLNGGDIVVNIRGIDYQRGDIVSFYYNNKVLVKRVIAFEGDVIDVDDEGRLTLNGAVLNESYVSGDAAGDWDYELPFTVPIGRIFVMGDNREESIDSRHDEVGCISVEQVIGKTMLRVWPFEGFGLLDIE